MQARNTTSEHFEPPSVDAEPVSADDLEEEHVDSGLSAEAAEIVDRVRLFVAEHPLAAIGIAAGAGFALGRLLRR